MSNATTFGLTPQAWWLEFRRALHFLNFRKMNDSQWPYALRLAKTRYVRPDRAAELVAKAYVAPWRR